MRAIDEDIEISKKKDTIIDGIMKSKGLYCLVSNAKVGKSMLSLQLSNALAKGEQFLGHNTMLSPVLYISTESDFGQIKERNNTLGLTFPKGTFFIADRGGKGEISIFDLEVDINEFANYNNGRFIIMDMLKDINLGINYDINNYQDVGQKLLPKLRSICEKYNVTILFTHHLNKRGQVLGSTAFDAVVDGKLTLIENTNDKSFIRLNIINRDFQELDIYLKKSDSQIFSVISKTDEEELDYDLVQFIKYIASKKEAEFTCSDIVNNAKLNRTPKQFGKLLNASLEILKCEGITIINCRNTNQRLYKATYEEVMETQ